MTRLAHANSMDIHFTGRKPMNLSLYGPQAALIPKNTHLALVPALNPANELLVSLSTQSGLIALLKKSPQVVKVLLTPPMLYFTAAALAGFGVGVYAGSQINIKSTVALLAMWANDPSLNTLQKAGKVLGLFTNNKRPKPPSGKEDNHFEQIQKQALWKSILQAQKELKKAVEVYNQRPDDDNKKIIDSKSNKLHNLLKKLAKIPGLSDAENDQWEKFNETYPDNADLLFRAVNGDAEKLKQALEMLRKGQLSTSEIIARLDGTQGSGGNGPRGPGKKPRTGMGFEDSPWRKYFEANLGRPPEGTLVRLVNEFIKSEISLPEKALILGTGDGAEAAYLASQGLDIVGVDLDPASEEFVNKSIQLRRQKPNSTPENFGRVTVLQEPFQTFKLPEPGSIGLIWSASLPFLSKKELPDVLKRINSTLKPDGHIVATFFGPKHPLAKQQDKAIYDENELKSLFKDFEIIKINRISPNGKLGDGTPVTLDLYEVIARKRQ